MMHKNLILVLRFPKSPHRGRGIPPSPLVSWMQNHAKLCFAHKSVVQAWKIIIFSRNIP